MKRDFSTNYPARIMMLVPHEPTLDPRVDWAIKLCAEIGKTDVFGFVFKTEKPLREYDQTIYLERVPYCSQSIPLTIRFFHQFFSYRNVYYAIRHAVYVLYRNIHHAVYVFVKSLPDGEALVAKVRGAKQSLQKRSGEANSIPAAAVENAISAGEQKLPALSTRSGQRSKNSISWRNKLKRAWNSFYTQKMIAYSLLERAQASSIIPKVIVCHDIQALEAGVKLKKKFHSRLLYDSHELWTEADLAATALEKHNVKSLERKLIRYADIVITVTPQIAGYLQKVYGIENVLTVPNAEPFIASTSPDVPVSLPVKFLLQGQAVAGRGFETLLDIWNELDDSRAVLILRCPDNSFLDSLKLKYKHLIDQGKVIVATAVKETELIQAASAADVGIIPYGGPNLNHVYACPNKLSQYMQAGLAILHNADQQFVTGVVKRYSCGASYIASNPSSFLHVARSLLDNPELLIEMKRNSYHAAQTEFNWSVQSKVYSQAIKQLLES